MRDLLIVIDSRFTGGEWSRWDTVVAPVAAEDDADAVAEIATDMAVTGRLAWNGELRVRAYPQLTLDEATRTNLDDVEPSAESVFYAIAEVDR